MTDRVRSAPALKPRPGEADSSSGGRLGGLVAEDPDGWQHRQAGANIRRELKCTTPDSSVVEFVLPTHPEQAATQAPVQ